MAITATHILTAASGSSLSSYTTASGSPTTGRLQLLTVGSQVGGGTVNTPTVTGAGLTWVEVATQIAGDNLRKCTVFRAMGTASAGALTIDFAGQSQIRAGWSWSEYDGVDTSGTNGSGAIVQSVTGKWDVGDGAKTSLTVNLVAFGSADNIGYGGIRFGTLTGGALTPGTDMNLLGTAISNTRYQSQYGNPNVTAISWTFPSEATFTQGVALEIKGATSGGSTRSRLPLMGVGV